MLVSRLACARVLSRTARVNFLASARVTPTTTAALNKYNLSNNNRWFSVKKEEKEEAKPAAAPVTVHPDDAPMAITKRQRIVIAVGGNALQRRGERLTIENMLKAAAEMAPTITQMARDHQLVLTHGNGPQVGELALERSAATLDVLGAESVGQIGYVLAQALSSAGCLAVPILTQVVVDDSLSNEAFSNPTKFVGPIYGAMEAQALAQSLGWTVKPDGEYFRRVGKSQKKSGQK